MDEIDLSPQWNEVALLITHRVDIALIEKYREIRACVPYIDIIMLINDEDGKGVKDIPADIKWYVFTMDMLNTLQYNPIEETLIPGSNHFALLWFYLRFPQYDHYWNIEYDVAFTGNWRILFDAFLDDNADFISCHVQKYKENPYWYWWNTYRGLTLNVPLSQRVRSFNPIYRISANALCFIDRFLKAGNSGHHEVLLPTALYHSGYKIKDFGGRGSFVASGNENRFYLSPTIVLNDGRRGSMRDKPSFTDITPYVGINKLFHPVK